MGCTEDILTVLISYSGGYRLLRARMRGYTGSMKGQRKTQTNSSHTDRVLRTTLSRLKNKGLVKNNAGEWRITKKGRDYLEKLRARFRFPPHTPKVPETTKKKPANMIIIFDIPEKEKKKRNWLRKELLNLGFVMLQKSAWLGFAPLPQSFIRSLHELRLLSFLKFFKAEEKEII